MSPTSMKLSPVLPNVNRPIVSIPIVYSVHSTIKVLKTFCFVVYIDFKYLKHGNSVLFLCVTHTHTHTSQLAEFHEKPSWEFDWTCINFIDTFFERMNMET